MAVSPQHRGQVKHEFPEEELVRQAVFENERDLEIIAHHQERIDFYKERIQARTENLIELQAILEADEAHGLS